MFVLGAGASKEAGAPLMLEFLDVADRLNRTGQVVPNAKEAFDDVAVARAALDAVYAKATIDADNLEEVFAAFDMAKLFNRFGEMDRKRVQRLPAALRIVIADVLDQTVRCPVRSGTKGSGVRSVVAPPTYEQFVDVIKALTDGKRESVSVITFNYDVGLDYALHRHQFYIDYCLTDAVQHHGTRSIDVMKLHGSVNWTPCKQCGIAAYRFEQYLKDWDDFSSISLVDLEHVAFDFRNRLTRFNHCNAARGPEEPAIIPPTWNKGAHHYPEIESVWRRAAGHFAQARTIVVMGYSLPSTDQFFRYLYAIGSLGMTRLERFIVINPDRGVRAKFAALLGRGVERRFEFRPWGFSGALTEVAALLLKGKPLMIPIEDRQ